MPTNHPAQDRPAPTIPPGILLVAGACLLAARLLAAHFQSFFQLDEVSLAAGVASLATGEIGNVYRYGPQAGYYRLVQGLAWLTGHPIGAVPYVMIVLSAVAGTVIPLCGLALFRDRLRAPERWVLAGILAANPILWMSSRYGNSAMPAAALLVLAVTVLSNRPARLAEAGALAAYVVAVLVRADTILAFPAVLLILALHHGHPRPVLARGAAVVLALGAVYGALMLADPRMGSAVHDVAEHLTNPSFTTKFWEYLLWSTSPLLLAAAVLGGREMAQRDPRLLAVLAVWCAPFFAFYFGSTTSPRYFIATTLPLAIAAAVALVALVPAPGRPWRRAVATVVAATASLHLVVGLGHFTPERWTNALRRAEFETHVGPMWSGALVYQTYLVPRLFGRSVRHAGFDRVNRVQRSLDSSLTAIAGGAERDRTVLVVLDGWNAHAWYFYAPRHGAAYVARAPGPQFSAATVMHLGGARLISVRAGFLPDSLPRGLRAGDAVWTLSAPAQPPGGLAATLPDGMILAVEDTTGPLARYRLREAPQ